MGKFFELAIKLLPSILQLMGVAEHMLRDKPNSGAEKKAAVMAATGAIINGIEGVSTGGQSETWERIKDPVSNIIDNAATIVFPEHHPEKTAGK